MDERITTRGTPWATTWDEAWADRVETAESVQGHRICGAGTMSGEPCTLVSDHPTGRCRYHGGTDLIGAPAGNQNARTHGLYARRLQRCGTHCPMWEHCPFAGDDVLALEPKERPVCAYEAAEYEELLEELSQDENGDMTEDGVGAQRRDRLSLVLSFSAERKNVALMQVMLSRAAAALSVTALTDTVTSESERYQFHSTKVHPALQAFLRISRELRAVIKDVRSESGMLTAASRGNVAKAARGNGASAFDSAPGNASMADIAGPLLKRSEGVLEAALEAETRREEYTRRLEWIAHDKLGLDWREYDSIREFALPRAVPAPGAPVHDPRFTTQHPPPNEHPAPLAGDGGFSESARGP